MTEALPNIDRYRVQRELGRGAMGVVYLAHDPKFERDVAIKTIKVLDGMAPEEAKEAKERFSREAKTAGGLNHPNILTVFDLDETKEGLAFLVTEYVKGQTVETILKSGRRLSESAVLSLINQVATGLAQAHKKGIVHRDIKPANLMRLDDGLIKIMDFGIAKIADSDLTQHDTALGSPAYMSPEQILGNPADGRSDLFSLGVTAYQLLTGERPYTGDSAQAVTYRIVNSDPLPPLRLNPQLNPGWNQVIGKLLAKSSEERYQSADALIADLEAMKAGGMTEGDEAISSTQATRIDDPGGTRALGVGGTQALGGTVGVTQQTSGIGSTVPSWAQTAQTGAAPQKEAPAWLESAKRNKGILIGGTVVLFLLALLAYRYFNSDIRLAKQLAAKENYKLAREYVKGVLAEEPDNTEALTLLAESDVWLCENLSEPQERQEMREEGLAVIEKLLERDDSFRKSEEAALWTVRLYGEDETGRKAIALLEETFDVEIRKKPLLETLTHSKSATKRILAAESIRKMGVEVDPQTWIEAADWVLGEVSAKEAGRFVDLLLMEKTEDPDKGFPLAEKLCAAESTLLLDRCLQWITPWMNIGSALARKKQDALATVLTPRLINPKTREKVFPVVMSAMGEKTNKALMDLTEDPDPGKAIEIMEIMKRLGKPAPEKTIVARLEETANAKKISLARKALKLLKADPPTRTYLYWTLRLLSNDASIAKRWAALKDLTDLDATAIKDPEVEEFALKLAMTSDLSQQARNWFQRNPHLLSGLEEAMKSPDYDRRWEALYALEHLGVKPNYEPVYKLDLKSENRQIRWNAARGLQKINKPVWLQPLYIKDLETSKDCDVRDEAIEWLGKKGTKTALPILEKTNDKGFLDDSCFYFGSITEAIEEIKKRGK